MTINPWRALPVVVVGIAILVAWYAGAVLLNAPQVIEHLQGSGHPWSTMDLIQGTWSMKRPVLPTPGQVGAEMWTTIFDYPPTNPRSLLYHTAITASSTIFGFVLGVLVGTVLAVGIVHLRTLESSLMPWVIASQTVPILAIAPMVVVILGNMGFTGVFPKAMISAYLSFFPVTIGLVKGLRSPDPLAIDLMHTYSASKSQTFRLLRLPTALPFLFASLKVAVAISLVGAIVAELPTGGSRGLGARLLTGSYYGLTAQIWAALVMAAILSLILVWLVGLVQRLVLGRSGAPA